MILKSIRQLHARIENVLRWSWIIIIAANLLFMSLFIGIKIVELKSSTTAWTEYFLDRLRLAEKIVDGDRQSPSLPVVHALTIDADGTIRKAPSPTLLGMHLNASGFFGRINDLGPGQIAIIFFPDIVDGIQRVHFVKRIAGDFIVNTFEPREFFSILLAGETRLSVVTNGVIWFSDDPNQIGNVYRGHPLSIDSGRFFASFSDKIPRMPEGMLVVAEDITGEIRLLSLTMGSLLLVFGAVSLRTLRVRKDFAVLQEEQNNITRLIQSLSAVIIQPYDDLSARLENLAPMLRQSFLDGGDSELQFEEYRQYRSLVHKFIDDILVLVEVIKEDALKLREGEERFSSLVSNIPGIVYRCANDPDWTMMYISDEISTISDHPASDFINNAVLSFASIIHPDDCGLVERVIQEGVREKRRYLIEYRICRPDGGIRWVSERGQGVFAPDGNLLWLDGVIVDITERKRAENDRIAREIAEQANLAKSEFLSRMSHELRTPLNSILGFSQLLMMDELKPNHERGLNQIHKSGLHLLNMVNQVLDIARIESGKLHIVAEPVSLKGVVEEAFELIRPLAEARGISLRRGPHPHPEVSVLADLQSLRQVLLNLLSNAVKYNREGGEIDVTTTIMDGHLRLEVRDTGEGIPSDKMGRLFIPFDRLGMETVEQEGTGLGLAISKGLVEAMGGCIGAESRPGEGSLFWLELKLAEE